MAQGGADASRERLRSLRPGVPLRRHRRVRPERPAERHGGAHHHLGHAGVGERRREADAAAEHGRLPGIWREREPLLGPLFGYPFVRFFSIWNESNLATFLVPQFDGGSCGPRNLRAARRGGLRGSRRAARRAQVAIGETSWIGRDRKQAGADASVGPGDVHEEASPPRTRALPFDAWAHHPYPFPREQEGQRIIHCDIDADEHTTLEKDLDIAFRRKNVKVSITTGNETKPGRCEGRRAEARPAAYIPRARALAREGRAGRRVHLVRDGGQPGNLCGRAASTATAAPPSGAAAVREVRASLSAINGKLTVKGGAKNPGRRVYLRSLNNAGAHGGARCTATAGSKLVTVKQGAAPLGVDCTIPVRVNGLTVAEGRPTASP